MKKEQAPDMQPIISLGAGVQSTAMCLMAAKGLIKPMPKAAIFADTQAEVGYKTLGNKKGEREGLYKWLDWLEDELPFPVYTVTKGDLTKASLTPSYIQKEGCKLPVGSSYLRKLIPVFGELMEDGKARRTAALGRKCTSDYKIVPVHRLTKEICGVKRGQKEATVSMWLGISYDELTRMRESRHKWLEHRWPLIEMEMSRSGCIKWMLDNGYPEPPRSACYYCPFHSDREWAKLKADDPEHFDDAVKFDKDLRAAFKEHDSLTKMTVYLHSSCKPLDEIEFRKSSDPNQLELSMLDECEGMCGI